MILFRLPAACWQSRLVGPARPETGRLNVKERMMKTVRCARVFSAALSASLLVITATATAAHAGGVVSNSWDGGPKLHCADKVTECRDSGSPVRPGILLPGGQGR